MLVGPEVKLCYSVRVIRWETLVSAFTGTLPALSAGTIAAAWVVGWR
jgi:hypothetical protein